MFDSAPWMQIRPEDDPVYVRVIAPFLARQHAALKMIDGKRRGPVHYVFHQHVERVADMGRDFALFCGAQETEADWYRHALMIHDCGKSLLPASIWDSEDKPTEATKAKRRSHAPLGAQMIEAELPADHPFTLFAADIARYHHEHMDGSGTLGVQVSDLSAWVRAACIVDSLDGMSVWRPHYKDRDISPAAVYRRLAEEKGARLYDSALLKAFKDFLII